VYPALASEPFAAFVRDADALGDDAHAIGRRLSTLLATPGWLAPEHQLPGVDTYRQHLLYVSPSRRMSVVALVWLPGQHTPIHDHVSWCVVGVHCGVEREERYRLVQAGGQEHLEPIGSVVAGAGHVEALVPPVDDIHSVTAAGTELAVSIHVYGADIEQRGTSILRRFEGVPILRTAWAA
jgi:3-mercaptopropionate dioxygenase